MVILKHILKCSSLNSGLLSEEIPLYTPHHPTNCFKQTRPEPQQPCFYIWPQEFTSHDILILKMHLSVKITLS